MSSSGLEISHPEICAPLLELMEQGEGEGGYFLLAHVFYYEVPVFMTLPQQGTTSTGSMDGSISFRSFPSIQPTFGLGP